MSECSNRRCADQLADGIYLCHKHTSELEADLRAVPSLWVDLRTTIGRMDATAASVGGGEGGSRPCMNIDAWDKAETLEAVLKGWGSQLTYGIQPFGDVKPATFWAFYLGRHMSQVRRKEWAGDLAAELRASINECQHATDRAADRITLGECGNQIGDVVCLGTVRSTVGASLGRCAECRAVYDVRERQQWMIAEAYHAAGSLRLIVQALRGLNQITTTYETVKKWAQRGKLYGVCDVETREHRYTAADVLSSVHFPPTGKRDVAV